MSEVLEPVLADVRATTDLELKIEPWLLRDGFEGRTVGNTGVSWPTSASKAEAVVMAADQVQDVVVEELWGHDSNWPRCPQHPTTHPMDARVVDGAPWWTCPADGRAVVRVGELRL